MIPPNDGAASRAAAARVLSRVRSGGESLRAALPALGAELADSRDRALAESSVFAACRGLFRYEAILQAMLSKPLSGQAAEVHALLLIALAQLDTLGMPAHAVVDASVRATQLLRQERMKGLVNALLRRFLRERADLLARIEASEPARFNHPAWLIEALRAAWGGEADAVMLAANAPPPLWLRVNARRIRMADYTAALDARGIAWRADVNLPQALCLADAPPARQLPGWEAGWVSVQDSSAQRATLALDAQPGLRMLDACAAPGGKTAALLETVEGLDLIALDSDPARLARVSDSLARLGLQARCLSADALAPERWWDGRPFDRILIDAPCSATGILRRQPDIRWHRRAADVPPLCALQVGMLDALWPLLAIGGRLIYATCSILPSENAQQIDAFLDRHADARALPLAAHFGREAGAGYQRLPGEDDGDGFFVAALQRVAA